MPFTTTIAGGDVGTASNTGIWLHLVNNTELLAREGAPAPGVDGAIFTYFDSLASREIGGHSRLRRC